MVGDVTVKTAKQMSVSDLAGNFIELRRAGPKEFAGPCPRCGGTDRFHCTAQWWFCRQCHPKRDDAIEFLKWARGMSFTEAVGYLTGESVIMETTKVQPQLAAKPHTAQSATWKQKAERLVSEAHEALMQGVDLRGENYLRNRGITPDAWVKFNLGYKLHFHPDSNQAEPAITIPWVGKDGLTAVRLRYLNPPSNRKLVALTGSAFAGMLYGRQGLCSTGIEQRTLVLCEGEINAVSIWLAQHEAALDVLSMGSESARLTDAMVSYARRYMRVIVWMDKPEIVRKLMQQIPGAYGFSSPGGMDANDLLRQGQLGGVLARVRLNAARTDEERSKLHDDIASMMRLPAQESFGVDTVLEGIAT